MMDIKTKRVCVKMPESVCKETSTIENTENIVITLVSFLGDIKLFLTDTVL